MDNYGSQIGLYGSYLLAEDCAVVGHGRYMFNTGGPSATHRFNIFRRCMARFDFSDSNQPMAPFGFYGNNDGTNTNNMLWQNCIAIDGQQANTGRGAYAYVWCGWYFPKNVYNSKLQGCVSLNNDVRYGGITPIENKGGEVFIENSIAWSIKNSMDGISQGFNFRGSGDGIQLINCTSGGNRQIMYNRNSGTTNSRKIVNFLSWDNSETGSIGSWCVNEYNAFDILSQDFGSNVITAQGLKYIVDPARGTNFASVGKDGIIVGAQILKKIWQNQYVLGAAGI